MTTTTTDTEQGQWLQAATKNALDRAVYLLSSGSSSCSLHDLLVDATGGDAAVISECYLRMGGYVGLYERHELNAWAEFSNERLHRMMTLLAAGKRRGKTCHACGAPIAWIEVWCSDSCHREENYYSEYAE